MSDHQDHGPGALREALLTRANALALPIATNSIDLVVTSPPYFGLRSYKDQGEHYACQIGSEATPDEFLDALLAATAEMARTLKPSGSIFVNLGDKYVAKQLLGIPWRYALRCVDELGLVLRAELIWHKPNALPEPVTDRVKRSHETWFHFTTGTHYYASLDAIRQPHKGAESATARRGPSGTNRSTATGRKHADGRSVNNFKHDERGKLPGSVWEVPTYGLRDVPERFESHYAAFPNEWPRRLILGWSPVGGIVLDPFSGTGSTVGVANALGRIGIGTDLSQDYLELSRWRTNESTHFDKVA